MENQYQKPAWMMDEQIKSIPDEKLLFLEEMFQNANGKSQKELMHTLLPLLRRAKQEGLNFTPQEINLAISVIKKYSTEAELKKIDSILQNKYKP